MRDYRGAQVWIGGQPLLIGQQVSRALVEALRGPCVRLEEWTDSVPAQGPIPPCMASFARPEIENCPLDMVQACERAAFKILHPGKGSLADVILRRDEQARRRGEEQDYQRTHGPSVKADDAE